jgi:hypothetical protein
MPKPEGCSGGGLWRIPDAQTSTNLQAKLVAVMIEYRGKPYNVILPASGTCWVACEALTSRIERPSMRSSRTSKNAHGNFTKHSFGRIKTTSVRTMLHAERKDRRIASTSLFLACVHRVCVSGESPSAPHSTAPPAPSRPSRSVAARGPHSSIARSASRSSPPHACGRLSTRRAPPAAGTSPRG